MRRLFRWAFRLALVLLVLGVLCVVAGILLLDTMTREILVSRLGAKTGMEVKIATVHVGLLSPTISIEGLKLYNTPDFGGALCLDMPELYIEYDASALRARRLHLNLLRLDLAELSVLQDKNGRNNFDPSPKIKESAQHKTSPRKLEFVGIDVMNVTLGKYRKSNMASGRGEDIEFGIKRQILRHVKTEKDLAPLGLTPLFHGKGSSTNEADLDLGQLLDHFLETP